MKPGGCEGALLRVLGMMPLLDRLELAAVSGWSRGAVYDAAGRLEAAGLVGSIPHATDLIPPVRRFHLTAAGLRRLARVEGMALDGLLRGRPVSAEWRRILLERLDAVAVVYRLAAALSNLAYPLPLPVVPRRAPRRRHRASRWADRGDRPAGSHVGPDGLRQAALAAARGAAPRDDPLLLPDEIRLRHARRLVAGMPVPALLALERDAALDGGGTVWRLPSVNAALDLRAALARLRPGGALPSEPPRSRATLPTDIAASALEKEVPDHLLPALLNSGGKHVLDLLSDWPWVTLRDLSGLLGVSDRRAAQLVASLDKSGLATRVTGRRLALTDRGLALLSHRDRAAVGAAKKRWSVAPLDPEMPLGWRNISGSRSRQLLRNAEHTAAVHRFVAALSRQASALGWEVAQLDPPRRASRYFRHRDGLRSIHPDAFGILRRDGKTWPFFLEWERRAVRPVTMAARIAPYLRYFSTHRPIDDHGVSPAVLVVFDSGLAATHFLRVAGEEMARDGLSVPLLVSHRSLLERAGPLGHAWRATTPNGPRATDPPSRAVEAVSPFVSHGPPP